MDRQAKIAALKLRARSESLPATEPLDSTHFTTRQRAEIAKMRLREQAERMSLHGLLPAYKLIGIAAAAGFVLGFFPKARGVAKHALPVVKGALSFLR